VHEIAVIGTGYVGLATGAALSSLGHRVRCVDVDEKKVNLLRQGQVPIVEEGLNVLVESGLKNGSLTFSTDIESEVAAAEVVFLCLPTPQADDGSADLSYVFGVLPLLAESMRKNAILVNKSTVPVGTAVEVAARLGREDVSVVSNPEFLRQGTAVQDFLHPTRVVVGADNPDAMEAIASLYKGVDAPVLRMKTASAEALKYAANAFLATKLTFINAMADICEVVGADIFDVATGIGMDPRIGKDMLNAGPGWGGSCFPKDTRALVNIAAKGGYDFALLRGVIETNDQHYSRVAEKAIDLCGGSVAGLTVAAWGLTFKAGTDDLRDSPAIKILTMLNDAGARVRAYDPTAKKMYPAFPWIEVVETPYSACDGADVLVVLTEWPEFRDIDPSQISNAVPLRRVVDGRNVLNREAWKSAGFEYVGIGR
jgi:UDPglucose 6-dehydrogenase